MKRWGSLRAAVRREQTPHVERAQAIKGEDGGGPATNNTPSNTIVEAFEEVARVASKKYTECRRLKEGGVTVSNDELQREVATLEQLCHELLLTIKLEGSQTMDPVLQRACCRYRGQGQQWLAYAALMHHNSDEVLYFLDNAQLELMKANDIENEILVLEEYLRVVPAIVETMKSDTRKLHLGRLRECVSRAEAMAADAVDKQVLQHDLHVLEQVIEDHENVCIAASKCPTDSTFPLYVYEPRKGSELFHHRRADIIDMREDSKDAISRELLPLSPQHGSVGNGAGDGIHRSPWAIFYNTMHYNPVGIIDSSEDEHNTDSIKLQINPSSRATSKSILETFHKKVVRLKELQEAGHEDRKKSMRNASEWSSVRSNHKAKGFFYWRANGDMQHFTVTSHADCRSAGNHLALVHSQDTNSPIELLPVEFAKYAIAVEQSEALKAFVVQKRLEVAHLRTAHRTENLLKDFRKQHAPAVQESLRLLRTTASMDAIMRQWCPQKDSRVLAGTKELESPPRPRGNVEKMDSAGAKLTDAVNTVADTSSVHSPSGVSLACGEARGDGDKADCLVQ